MVKSFTWRRLISLWKVIRIRHKYCPSGYLWWAVSTARVREIYSGVATLLALCAGLTCRLTYRVQWTYSFTQCWLVSRLRYPQLWVATSLHSAEVWGPHLLKNLFGDRSPLHRFICGGVVCPLFYWQMFLKTSINTHSHNHFFCRDVCGHNSYSVD